MPLAYISVRVVRPGGTVTDTGGLALAETEIAGSPFTARIYRSSSQAVQRDEAEPDTTTKDEMTRMSVLDPACPIRINDIVLLPLPGGATQRAKVILPRRYADRVQFDLETGAE